MINIKKKNFFYIGLPLFVFILFNWIYFVIKDPYACNDYFGYYFYSEKLFSGSLNLIGIPPLFPFLLGLLGRIFGFFKIFKDPFIFAGQFISFLSAIGTCYYTYKIFESFFQKKAIFPVIYLIISSFFLSLVSTPQTDMLFLFFISLFFYYLITDKNIFLVLLFLILIILTRNEGLLFIIFLFKVEWIKKIISNKWLLLAFGFLSSLFLFILYSFFYQRLINKLFYIFNDGLLVYYFKNPIQIQKLLWGTFFKFIPNSLHSIFDFMILYLFILFFLRGLYSLFKRNRSFFYQVLFFLLLFMMFKGYAKELNPAIEFRRWLPFLWTFFIIASIGGLEFIKLIYKKSVKKMWLLFFILLTILSFYIFANNFFISSYLLIIVVLALPLYFVISNNKKVKISILYTFVFFVFSIGLLTSSIKRTMFYIQGDTNIGSYKMAKWLNDHNYKGKILTITHPKSLKYYLENRNDITLSSYGYTIFKDSILNDKKKTRIIYLKYLKKRKIGLICFNHYGNNDSVSEEYIKFREMIELEIKEGKYIKVIKNFYYNKHYVGSISRPDWKNIEEYLSESGNEK